MIDKLRNNKKIKIGNLTTGITCILLWLFLVLITFAFSNSSNPISNFTKKVMEGFNVYTREIPSVEIESSDYDDPGSYNIEKSAKWIANKKARITFDLDTIAKEKENINYHDVILVLDVSGSMVGEKLDKVKSDSKELVESLLSNSNNKVALVTFESSSIVHSGFTNNKQEILNKIDILTNQNNTNYNSGYKNVFEVMDRYNKEPNRDLVMLFLTDGYPNEDNPNQVGTYEILKEQYPYMTINGVQYEMGEEIRNEIKEVTDNQWTADMDSLNNILFEASKGESNLLYDTFVIEDYIDDEYFEVVNENDINPSRGTIRLTEEGGKQKVTWTLDNKFRTGSSAKLTIDVKLKNKDFGETEYYPTNEKEEITSKIEDESEKTKISELTPVLKSSNNVIYDTNTPTGCTLPDIASEKHTPYSNVTKKSDKLTCAGYNFKGWEMVTPGITKVNDDVFIMPGKDVTIRASWTKQSIEKSMNGTVKTKVEGTLRPTGSSMYYTFGKNISRESFESITTVDYTAVPSEAIDSWDVSQERNNSVIAWYTDTDNNSKYELYIGQDDGVTANPDSSFAFYYFTNATIIDLRNFDTSKVTTMESMFGYAGYSATIFEIKGLNSFDTSKVTDMRNMFYQTGKKATTWSIGDLSSWDTSKVTTMDQMFDRAGYNATTFDIGNLSNWDTSKVTTMSYMFREAGYETPTFDLEGLSNWDTSQVTRMVSMFDYSGYNSQTFDIGDLSKWNTSSVTNMYRMFNNAGYNATTWSIGDLSNWDTSKVTTMQSMFDGSGSQATTFNIGNLSKWDTSKVTTMQSMFSEAGYNATTWSIGDLSNWDTSSVTSMSGMFGYAGYNATTWNSIGTLKVYATDIDQMFYDCPKAKATLNIYSNPTSYSNAFYAAATNSSALITVNYSSATTNIDDIIGTKSSNSNVVKGSLLP